MKEEIIIAYLNNELPAGERKVLEKWIQHSEKNRKAFGQVKMIWDNSRVDFSRVEIDSGKAWDQIRRSIPEEGSSLGKRSKRSPGTYLRIAASVVVLLGMAYLSARLVNKRVLTDKEWITVQSTANPSDIELPDESRVWLNKNSSISYPERFRSGLREVRISGEAFFDVTKDRRRPFIVSTEMALIEVLGTSFNVESGGVKEKEIVTLVSGRVAFSEKENPANTLILEPGERGILYTRGNRMEKGKNSDHNFLAWKTGILTFKGDGMAEVCSTLSDHFDIPVLPDPQADWGDLRLSATYDNKKLEEVLKILTLTLHISYESTKDTITLFHSPQ